MNYANKSRQIGATCLTEGIPMPHQVDAGWSRKKPKLSQTLGRSFDRAMRGDVEARRFVVRALKAMEIWPLFESVEVPGMYRHATSVPADQVLEMIRGIHR